MTPVFKVMEIPGAVFWLPFLQYVGPPPHMLGDSSTFLRRSSGKRTLLWVFFKEPKSVEHAPRLCQDLLDAALHGEVSDVALHAREVGKLAWGKNTRIPSRYSRLSGFPSKTLELVGGLGGSIELELESASRSLGQADA